MAHENGAPDARLNLPNDDDRDYVPAHVPADRADHALNDARVSENPAGSNLIPVLLAAAPRTSLADRIVALPPTKLVESFRTKVKVKAAAVPDTIEISPAHSASVNLP